MEIKRMLETKDGHKLAIYQEGNPLGPSVIYLHGGPGGSVSDKIFEYFDLSYWNVIAFDQRGCGNSVPFASLHNNTVDTSVEDVEAIRQMYGLETMTLFGGSYGTTLALSYAIKYPQHVTNLVLRGVFLGRDEDIAWLYQEGASYFYPQEHELFKSFIEPDKQHDLVQAYYEIFKGSNHELKLKAAKRWADWENSVVLLIPQKLDNTLEASDKDISLALLECHYFANHMFWDDDNYILNNTDRIRHIPCYIVHGRYDVDCRPSGAHELAKAFEHTLVQYPSTSGHSGFEPETFEMLKGVLESLKHA